MPRKTVVSSRLASDARTNGGGRLAVAVQTLPPPRPVVTHVNIVQNWFEELKAKVPPR